MSAKVIVLTGYGINCEEETLHAFELAGLSGEIVHANDLADGTKNLKDYQIMAVPGGFSYGDDTGSGNAYALRLKNALKDELQEFFARDTLSIGICNGCQILTRLGAAPAIDGAKIEVALQQNTSTRYQCRWVDLKVENDSPWLKGVETLHIPVAHGEGNFQMSDEVLGKLRANNQVGLRYTQPDGSAANGEFPANPNGAMDDIAGITNADGRVLALMPHPERGMFFTQREDWPLLKEQLKRQGKEIPEYSDGFKLFQNAAEYFK